MSLKFSALVRPWYILRYIPSIRKEGLEGTEEPPTTHRVYHYQNFVFRKVSKPMAWSAIVGRRLTAVVVNVGHMAPQGVTVTSELAIETLLPV